LTRLAGNIILEQITNMNRESSLRLSGLKRSVARIERQCLKSTAVSSPVMPTGHAEIDAALGGGIAGARLHDIYAASLDDASSAAGFAAMLARQQARTIVWLRQDDAERNGGLIHAPGLAEIGIDPARIVLCVASDATMLLRAAADVVRCAQAGVAVIELWRNPSVMTLTASRRLALAAETSGTTALLLRVDAEPVASAAATRWRITSVAARPLAANAPGYAALSVELLCQRGRSAQGCWPVEWSRDDARFVAPVPGVVLPVPAQRPSEVAVGERFRRAA